MPNAKLNVVQLMNHGVGSPTAVSPRAPILVQSASPVVAAEFDAQAMKAASSVKANRLNIDLTNVVKAARTPAELAANMIQARYNALGGIRSFLGKATTQVTRCPDKVGFFRHFAKGSIYWHPQAGAHEVHGDIRALWSSLQWERGFLGYPRTDEMIGADPDKKGRYNHFQGGSVYWHPTTGAHEVHGAIRQKYFELGAEKSFLGYPTTHETATPDRAGRFNHFQGGSIYWTGRTSAHEVHGLIRGYWATHGWERNAALGYPISDERIPDRGIGHRPGLVLQYPLGVLVAEQPSPLLNLAKPVVVRIKPITKKPVAKKAPIKKVTLKKVSVKTKPAARVVKRKPIVRAKNTQKLASISQPVSKVNLSPAVLSAAKLQIGGRPVLINAIPMARDHTGLSRDRYSDFEDGVVFWRSGAAQAELITPRTKAPNGAKMAWSSSEVAALIKTQLQGVLRTLPGGTLLGAIYAGTTEYTWDGAGVHNRHHRCNLVISGRRRVGSRILPSVAVVEVLIEVSFDPVDREIGGYLTSWKLKSSQGDFYGGGDLLRNLHARLDAQIWRQFPIAKVPATAKNPIAVLSVKTQADGRVAVYFEP